MIYVSACEPVDGLPVITHGEEMSLVCSNKGIHEAGHGCRGVLELVNEDMTKLRERTDTFLYNVSGPVKHVREIDSAFRGQFSLVSLQNGKTKVPKMMNTWRSRF